jgi:tetratricopeptide (TPR) repeat protein
VAKLPDRDRTALDTYEALLERYASGDYEGAADAAAAMSADDVRGVLAAANEEATQQRIRRRSLGLAEIERLRAKELRFLVRSVLLQTEAATRTSRDRFVERLTLARDGLLRLEEFGREVRLPPADDGAPGLLYAPAPARVMERSWLKNARWPALRVFAWQWHVTVATMLQATHSFEPLDTFVEDALREFRRDPDLLLARGSLYETRAGAEVIDASVARDIYTDLHRNRHRDRLLRAASDFGQAIRQDPALYEAHLRLGRVRFLLGEHDRAEEALRAASVPGAPLLVRYLAAVFGGGVAEASRDEASARQSYERALDLLPGAQAPMLALSRLCDARGDTACARRWLVASLNEVDPKREDYWWTYPRGQTWRIAERIAELRRLGLE